MPFYFSFNKNNNNIKIVITSSPMKLALVLFFASSLFLQGTLGEIICEELPSDICSFSIASSGKRCLLENFDTGNGNIEYQCRTSEVVVERMSEHIETDECVSACGVDRNAVGISSDTLLEAQSVSKLCSPPCYQNCANIVDLYFDLAAGEGVYFPDLCEKQKTNPHRAMIELLSSGAVAAGPATNEGSLALEGALAPTYIYALAPTYI